MNKIHPYLRSTVTTAAASEIPAISSRQDVSPNASIMAPSEIPAKDAPRYDQPLTIPTPVPPSRVPRISPGRLKRGA